MLMKYFFMNLINLILTLLMVLMSVAFLTLFERKILGYIQDRKGPNKVGFLGLFQPFSDVIKLMNKEFFMVDKINYYYYNFSSILILFLSMMMWLLYFFEGSGIVVNMGIMYLLTLMSLGVYPMMLGGWSSNSNYSMMGCLRSISQSVSFEVSLFLIIFVSIMMIESYSFMFFSKYSISYVFFMMPIYIMFLISLLIELNRTPFDLAEGESELVSGFNTEYFSGRFALIFMAEYLSIIFMSFLVTIMFFNYDIASFKFLMFWIFHIFFIIWIRGVLPRIRYDELMMLCWKKFLSIVLCYLLMMVAVKFLILCNIFYCDYPYWLAIISGIMN